MEKSATHQAKLAEPMPSQDITHAKQDSWFIWSHASCVSLGLNIQGNPEELWQYVIWDIDQK